MKSFFRYILNFKGSIQRYFDFSVRETNGFLVLLLLIVLYVAFTFSLEFLFPPKPISIQESKTFDSIATVLEQNIALEKPVYNSKNYSEPKAVKTKIQIKYFDFDPNLLSVDSFMLLGFEPYIAQRIDKYRSKGGKFKDKKDLLKIYGFKTELFNKIESYIKIAEPATKFTYQKPKTDFKKLPVKLLDINEADSASLEKVYGIGVKLAARIVKYRNKLGGFVDLKQLNEVYGLDSVVIGEITKKFNITPDFSPQKININQADFNTLKSHPYIGYKLAKVILAFKNQHGNFNSIENLSEIKIITTSDIERLIPYIEF